MFSLIILEWDTRTDPAKTKVASELELIDLVFILRDGFKWTHGSGNTEQSIALLPELLRETHGF